MAEVVELATCHICDKGFEDLEKHFFDQHISRKFVKVIHEVYANYKCESCDKSFSQEGDLNGHIHSIHEGHNVNLVVNHLLTHTI